MSERGIILLFGMFMLSFGAVQIYQEYSVQQKVKACYEKVKTPNFYFSDNFGKTICISGEEYRLHQEFWEDQ